MSSQLAPRSSYLTTGLGRAEVFEVQDVARSSALVTELAKVANYEMARIGAHAVGTMAELVQGAGNIHRELIDSGHRDDVFPDMKSTVLQVTGQNLITMSNTGQQEIMRKAAYHMR